MAETDLVTLNEVKNYIGGVDSDDSVILQTLITAATAAIEAHTGKAFVERQFTEDYSGGPKSWVRGGSKVIQLNHYPVVSVSSITDDDGETVPASDYTVIAELGQLEHESWWPRPEGRWTIVYTAGSAASTQEVDDGVKQAAIMTVASWFQGRDRDPALVSKKVGDVSKTYRDGEDARSGLPGTALHLLSAHRRIA